MIETLREVCGDDEEEFLRVRALLEVERNHNSSTRRAGLYDALEKVLMKHGFEDEEDALAFARFRRGEPDKEQGALF
ncbi:hypothetical protein [Streptomyces sp. NPDC058548]|uniref:hypothetical protein n=1 Tax=Streptomyces sp. NPDC058548 TaxID=3346545 RepID=UPI00364F566D